MVLIYSPLLYNYSHSPDLVAEELQLARNATITSYQFPFLKEKAENEKTHGWIQVVFQSETLNCAFFLKHVDFSGLFFVLFRFHLVFSLSLKMRVVLLSSLYGMQKSCTESLITISWHYNVINSLVPRLLHQKTSYLTWSIHRWPACSEIEVIKQNMVTHRRTFKERPQIK